MKTQLTPLKQISESPQSLTRPNIAPDCHIDPSEMHMQILMHNAAVDPSVLYAHHHNLDPHFYPSPVDPTIYLRSSLPAHQQQTLMYPTTSAIDLCSGSQGTPINQQSHSTPLSHLRAIRGIKTLKKIPSSDMMHF
eukprot:CAMPEP_0170451422 /NCGR_PEP_ID=MMETSP0123-20130129/670_1 /TAXON_ID=182087 /ORGANISM="Favella ehrenbergii, Strain Fehren 1" /LENGTH=135 /DNA_ID=CAMNT_0010713111 /DNA_START=99 /DNA_END=506 /DNA_ORIENTATION=-